MKKKLLLALAGIMSLSLMACSSGSGEQTSGEGDNTGEVSKDETILIYSNSAAEGRGEWVTEKAKEAGFNIEVVQIPGADLANRLIAEKHTPLADMFWGINTLDTEKLKAEDLLLQYEPDWAAEIDPSLKDSEGYYYPLVIQPLVLIGNADYDMPSDWTDLVDEKYNDQYHVFNLGGGTSKTILSSIISRYPDPNGEYGISEEGWEVTKAYIQNASFQQEGEDYVGKAIDGTIPMTMMWGSGVIQNQNERDYEFQVMSPEIGVPYVTEQIGIVNGTEKQELIEEYINWFGSPEVQSAWSAEFGSIPAHKDALATVSDDVSKFMNKVPTSQELDWGFIAENIDQWVEKVELEFVQ